MKSLSIIRELTWSTQTEDLLLLVEHRGFLPHRFDISAVRPLLKGSEPYAPGLLVWIISLELYMKLFPFYHMPSEYPSLRTIAAKDIPYPGICGSIARACCHGVPD